MINQTAMVCFVKVGFSVLCIMGINSCASKTGLNMNCFADEKAGGVVLISDSKNYNKELNISDFGKNYSMVWEDIENEFAAIGAGEIDGKNFRIEIKNQIITLVVPQGTEWVANSSEGIDTVNLGQNLEFGKLNQECMTLVSQLIPDI